MLATPEGNKHHLQVAPNSPFFLALTFEQEQSYCRSTLLVDYQMNHHFEVVLLYIFSYHWARIIDNSVIEMSDDITDGVFHKTSR